jgi:hypothetical protein
MAKSSVLRSELEIYANDTRMSPSKENARNTRNQADLAINHVQQQPICLEVSHSTWLGIRLTFSVVDSSQQIGMWATSKNTRKKLRLRIYSRDRRFGVRWGLEVTNLPLIIRQLTFTAR